MSRICVAPIVEGHGEEEAVRVLLTRIWTEVLGGEWIEVVRPIRVSKSKFLRKPDELHRAVRLAVAKIKQVASAAERLVLILLDADEDIPCKLGPDFQERAAKVAGDVPVACVIANVEYETWFVAAAESLADVLDIDAAAAPPENPEQQRLQKGWIQARFREGRYSETVDQPAMTARMDLHLCRRRAPSFDKLCRELERHLRV